eukprot:TRINITY_DN2914_c0_g1_i1.p1 TRINITY_DN2914_c0_g1~~TRINITY_DN2914_c0_g1_i1.p1  ORF type:complete len:755 (-),score=268.17 TRINITY_DN2914_c0_g1_i1:49-2313(-)
MGDTPKTEVNNKLVQIIDGDGQFTPVDNLREQIKDWDFLNKGFDYFVVAILGCQSSGKSTLLNYLFGTSFQTMEAQEGRTQTTLGVWMGRSKAKSAKDETILVFDVEGTDSRERGEQAAMFERKTSLFSLALAEVLIVNMWHTDVGRYNAGNIALLKTVFELNLQLFSKKGGTKTLILFLIRDHIPRETPLEKLKGIILKDMSNIWESLIKPPEFVNSKAEDFFDFQFTALPHKVLAEDEFYKGIDALRSRFVDAHSPEFILGKEYHKDVPADGFVPYAENIWQVVKENKDLDLPTQKEMLAMYRCDEISAEAKRHFDETMASTRKSLEKGELVQNFGPTATEAYQNALVEYDGPSSRYHPDVAKNKREVLANKLNDDLYAMFQKLLLRLLERSVTFFEKQLADALPKDGSAVLEFGKLKEEVVNATLKYFRDIAQGSLLSGSNWSYEQEERELVQIINKQIAVVKKVQLEKLMKEIKTQFNTTVLKPLDKILENPVPEMWSQIRDNFKAGKEKLSQFLQDRLQGYELSEEETVERLEELQMNSFTQLKEKFQEKAKYLPFLMSKKFEQLFNLDENQLPRRWKPTDDIKSFFLTAREKTESLLEQFSLLRLQDEHDSLKYLDNSTSDVDDKFVILTRDEAQVIKDKFYKDTQSNYLQALRDQENVNSVSSIPAFVIILILILGFDEFWAILTSPLLLILTVMLGGGFYVVYMMNMLGPAQSILQGLFRTSLKGAQVMIQKQLNPTPTPDPKKDN